MKYLLAFTLICSLVLSTACTQSPEKLIAAANRYHHNKKYKEASILYQKAIAKDRTNAEAYYREGLNLLDFGEPGEAARYLRRAVDLKPTNTDAEAKLAEIMLFFYSHDSQKYKSLLSDARELVSKLLQQQPNSFDGLRLQAIIFFADKNFDKSLQTFAKANQIKPYSRELVGWYAQALLSAHRPEDAYALVEDMLTHDPKWGPGYDFLFLQYSKQNLPGRAEAVLRKRLQNDPSNPIAIQNLANYLLATNRFGEGESIMRQVLENKKKIPAAHLLLGDFYLHAKKFDQAIQEYQTGVKEDSKNDIEYQERIIGVYSLTGRRDQALESAKTLASKNPKNSSALEMYASLLLQSGSKADATKSLGDLKNMVQKNPNNAVLHLDLARAYFTLGDKDKSLSEAIEAIRQQPSLFPARLIAARIYEDRGQHPKAIEQTSLVLESQPGNADARLIRDRALVGTGQFGIAESDLETLVQQFPQANDARVELATLYLNQRQYAKASEEFQRLWTSNPPDSRGYLGLQMVKLAQGNGDDAVRALQDLVQKNPNVAAYRYQLANFEATAGGQAMKSNPAHSKELFQDASDNYKELLKVSPNSADVWLRLGILQRQLGENDAALTSFAQAERTNPRNAEAFLNHAMLLEEQGKKQEAMDTYNKVLGIEPDNSLALNNLAFLTAEMGKNLDQALTLAQRAKQRVPDNPDISDTLGYVYYQRNLNTEALRIFRQLVQDQPQNATFRFHLAMALLKQGDKRGARDQAEKALRTASQPSQQDEIRSFVSHIG